MRILIFLLLAFPGLSLGNGGDFPKRTIDQKIRDYEKKLATCEKLESSRDHPGEEAINTLLKYTHEDIRRFLISKSAISLHNCTMPEIGVASFIIGAIRESRHVSQEIKEYASEKSYLLHVSTWGFYDHLNSLPPEMQTDLAKHNYFEKPFDAVKILDQLGIH